MMNRGRRHLCSAAGLGWAASALSPWAQAAEPEAKHGAAKLKFGTVERPFSAQSPWNSRPVEPELGDSKIPGDDYKPAIELGTWSTGVFVSAEDDKPMRVIGRPGQPGIWDPDGETHQPEVVIPRWPAAVLPSKGTDGHADIVDPRTGIIHSFFMLKQVGEDWRAQQYAWTKLGGRGWGDPAHYFQGARAAAVPTMGGLIRRHEVEDGDTMYRHALAMSLTFSGLSARPGYVFPATSADEGLERNKGTIPEGALLMLPPAFDVQQLDDPRLRKIAETLKVYGGYVVDRNIGTPFVIYAEIGSALRLHPAGGWNNKAANDLERIRTALRPLASAASWVDGHGKPVELKQPMNVMSMRGTWLKERGDAQARYDTWKQAVVLKDADAGAVVANESARSISQVNWAKPKPGQKFRLTARTGNSATLRLQLRGKGGGIGYDSGELANGKTVLFDWPETYWGSRLTVRAGASGDAWASGELVAESDG